MAVPAAALAAVGMGTPGLGEGISTSMGLVTEIVVIFFLVFVVFGMGIDARAPQVGGFFIGLTVALDIMMGGPISGSRHESCSTFGASSAGGWAPEHLDLLGRSSGRGRNRGSGLHQCSGRGLRLFD